MSKKTKTASREKRSKDKRAKKAANKARYAAMRDSGQNSKSYRAMRNASGSKKIRMFRDRARTKRMSNVPAQPIVTMTPSGVGAYITPRTLTWRQAHNQVSAKVFMRNLRARLAR